MIEQARRSQVEQKLTALAPELSPQSRNILCDMYSRNELRGTVRPEPVTIDDITRVPIEQGAQLNRLLRDYSVTKSIEIGFAYGFSTIWLLDALLRKSGTSHRSVDPFELTSWEGVGLEQVGRLEKPEGSFTWIEDYSIHAFSDLIRQGEKFDFIFIDGNHRFDDVIVDFYLSDQLLLPGGLIVLDDMWMDAIRAVANFIEKNRDYELVRQPVRNMNVFRKIRDDDRPWHHYRPFRTYGGLGDALTRRLRGARRKLSRSI